MAGGEPVPNPATLEGRQLKGKTSPTPQNLHMLWEAAADSECGKDKRWLQPGTQGGSLHLGRALVSRNGPDGDLNNVVGNLCDQLLSTHFLVWTLYRSWVYPQPT